MSVRPLQPAARGGAFIDSGRRQDAENCGFAQAESCLLKPEKHAELTSSLSEKAKLETLRASSTHLIFPLKHLPHCGTV